MVQKLRVIVRVDLDTGSASIKVLGKLDGHTLIGLYSLIRRTSSITPGLTVEVDLRRAAAEPAALADLHETCAAGHLPARVDPRLSDCRLLVLEPNLDGSAVQLSA
ncbi:hypothetical protein LVY72_09350 [Arthrobacter sp. I2-34]|uniref:Uncharacterized protein n=1 Tax=Arthrobacter hankyongi TaxID=2904801 RepID=A0ABS9L6B2_9MICC|nr:hypothetical protein [Arthrobacter hankyongi]MCG2622123.1 hypothetical protein [Arthrobacter hankyongi]